VKNAVMTMWREAFIAQSVLQSSKHRYYVLNAAIKTYLMRFFARNAQRGSSLPNIAGSVAVKSLQLPVGAVNATEIATVKHQNSRKQ
jgi:hypothetical protein